MMMAAAFLLFLPLGFVFLSHPAAFSGRASQVQFQVEGTAEGLSALAWHMARAFSLFLGAADPRIRHQLIERPVFDPLTLLAFWLGVAATAWNWRKAENLFLLAGLVILWLPAPLSVDPIHSPRSSGMLSAFFILTAVGFWRGTTWVAGYISRILNLPAFRSMATTGLISFALVMLTGLLNIYDYFGPWATHPLVYQEYKGPAIDLARYAAALTSQADVLLPYHFFAYAPVRYSLHDDFQEELGLPFDPVERLAAGRPLIYLTWPEQQAMPQFIWLTRDAAGRGRAYLTRLQEQPDPGLNRPVTGSRQTVIGGRQELNPAQLARLYAANPLVTTPFVWKGHIRLAGYDLAPPLVRAGQPVHLTLYWQGLQDADLAERVFIQLLDGQGRPVSQLEDLIIKDRLNYFENRTGIVIQPYLIWTGVDAPAGLYLFRFGLFNPRTGARQPITILDQRPAGDQVIIAPFFVTHDDNHDPRRPEVSLPTQLGEGIELLGYSPASLLARPLSDGLNIKLYWLAHSPIPGDYTVFVQLLDARNQIVSQADAQPLAGLYPTSQWQPGQVLVSQFTLPPPAVPLKGEYRLVTGMYDLITGIRLPAFKVEGRLLPDNMIVLAQESIPERASEK